MSTADTILEIAKTVGPAVTGVGGALATLWRTTHSIFRRLSDLEKNAETCKERTRGVSTKTNALEARIAEDDKRIRSLEFGLDQLQSELAKAHTEIASLRASLGSYVSQSAFAKQLERMASLERRASELDDALSRQDSTMINFAKEQHEQWQGINRSLGQLEGFIKARQSVHEG